MAMTDAEKETIIRFDKETDMAVVYTHEVRMINRLKKEMAKLEKAGGRLVREGKYEGTPWAEFVVPIKWVKVTPPRDMKGRKPPTPRKKAKE